MFAALALATRGAGHGAGSCRRGGTIFFVYNVQQPSQSFWQGCDTVSPLDTCNLTMPDHDVQIDLG